MLRSICFNTESHERLEDSSTDNAMTLVSSSLSLKENCLFQVGKQTEGYRARDLFVLTNRIANKLYLESIGRNGKHRIIFAGDRTKNDGIQACNEILNTIK